MDWYPHHIADFNQATRHLDRIERSIYRDLLDLYYDREEPIPGDVELVARLILANDCSTVVEQVLNEFFVFAEGTYTNARCDGVIAEHQARQAHRVAAGKASARARRRPRGNSGNGRSTSVEQTTTITKTTKPPKSPKGDAARQLKDLELPVWLNRVAWKEFVQHRKEMRMPLTYLAGTKALAKLDGLTAKQQDECISNTIQNRWRGLFPEKITRESGGKVDGKLTLPRTDELLASFAKQHDLSAPRPGETFPQYRGRLNNEIERR